MHSIPLAQTVSFAGVLAHPLKTLSTAYGTWKASRRRRADLALLMSMDSHMLNDIGVILSESKGPSAVLKWHPAVLASTFDTSSLLDSDKH